MKYFCILLFLISATIVKANTGCGCLYNLPTARLITDTDSVVKKRSVYAGVSYGSDALFFGRTGPIKYTFFSNDVIYNSK